MLYNSMFIYKEHNVLLLIMLCTDWCYQCYVHYAQLRKTQIQQAATLPSDCSGVHTGLHLVQMFTHIANKYRKYIKFIAFPSSNYLLRKNAFKSEFAEKFYLLLSSSILCRYKILFFIFIRVFNYYFSIVTK